MFIYNRVFSDLSFDWVLSKSWVYQFLSFPSWGLGRCGVASQNGLAQCDKYVWCPQWHWALSKKHEVHASQLCFVQGLGSFLAAHLSPIRQLVSNTAERYFFTWKLMHNFLCALFCFPQNYVPCFHKNVSTSRYKVITHAFIDLFLLSFIQQIKQLRARNYYDRKSE